MATALFWTLVVTLSVWFNITTEAERGQIWRTLVVVFFLVFGGMILVRFTLVLATEGPIAAVKLFSGESAPPTH